MKIPKDMQKNLVFPFRSRAAIQILPHTGALQIALHGNTVFVIMKRKRNEYQIQITNDGELPSKDAKEGGGLSALRKAVEAEGGSMNTFFEPAFYLLLNLPLFDEEY